jgi:putative redox protein
MVQILIEYTGNLHCDAKHGPSGAVIATDAPTDNQGKGEAFSPTDLVATALGTCIATTMAIVAERHQVELKGMTVQVQKEMASNPRRIGRLTTEVHIPLPADHPQRALLEQTALGCPVHRSLSAEMERPTEFLWEG